MYIKTAKHQSFLKIFHSGEHACFLEVADIQIIRHSLGLRLFKLLGACFVSFLIGPIDAHELNPSEQIKLCWSSGPITGTC